MIYIIDHDDSFTHNVVHQFENFDTIQCDNFNEINEWKDFARRCVTHSKELSSVIDEYDGKIVAYGASARSSTLLNFCKINNKKIKYIIDKSEMKQGLFTAGSNIKIISLLEATKDIKNIEVILLLAWNFQDEIIKEIKSLGFKGKVIIPLPFKIKIL